MIRIIACGKLKEKWLREGTAEYLKRISPYDRIEMIEVQDEKAPENNSDKDNEKVKKTEGERILKRIQDEEYVILLDLAGKEWSSEEMAAHRQFFSKLFFETFFKTERAACAAARIL